MRIYLELSVRVLYVQLYSGLLEVAANSCPFILITLQFQAM
jgi:hypothetical protein